MHAHAETAAAQYAATTTFVLFELSGQKFGVDVGHVREILDNQTITPMPNAASGCIGVADTRGESIPVIDLAHRFGMTPADATEETRIVVFEIPAGNARQPIGVRADRVLSVLPLEIGEIEPAPACAFAGLDGAGVEGLVRRDGALVTLLRVDRLLGPADAALSGAGA